MSKNTSYVKIDLSQYLKAKNIITIDADQEYSHAKPYNMLTSTKQKPIIF